MLTRTLLVGLVAVTACAGEDDASNGELVAGAVEAWWQDNERLAPGDRFSDEERDCMANRSESVDLGDVEEAADGDFLERTPMYLAPYVDECLTDAHLQEYLRVDQIIAGLRPAISACMAPEAVRIIRQHGFAAVLPDDRTTEIDVAFDAATARCEANGERVVELVASWWRDHAALGGGGDEFTAAERSCMADRSVSMDLEELERSIAAESAAAVVIAPYADDCLSDRQLRSFFVEDMVVQGFERESAECLAERFVGLVRRHGYGAVFGERNVQITGEVNEARSACGIDP